MEKPYILHMFTPAKNLSPFDVNMACDAGWNTVVPYTSVETDEVQGLVQDAIFSRGPSGVKRTGIFLGGRDMHMAMDMLDICKGSMVPPFEVSCFADPSGAFTTASGMVAAVEEALAKNFNTTLEGKAVMALGGTGPVGSAGAILAAKAGAKVKILGRKKDKAQAVAELCSERYGVDVSGIEGEANERIDDLIEWTDVVLATAAAGIEVLNAEQIGRASSLLVAADVNAVPPPGVAGLGAHFDREPLPDSKNGAVGVGALAIGNVKYQAQHRLLKKMCESDKPVYYHFEDAFEVAREYIKER